MYKLLSLALLALAAMTQAAPGALEPRDNGAANIEAVSTSTCPLHTKTPLLTPSQRKVTLTTIGYKTAVVTQTLTILHPIVRTVRRTQTTRRGGRKTTITVTDTVTSTQTATSTLVTTTTSPVVSTVTVQPAPASTTPLAPATTTTTTAASSTTVPTTTPASPSPSPQSRACEALPATFTDANGRSYTNICNTDAYGGDLALVYTGSFEACYAVCDGKTWPLLP